MIAEARHGIISPPLDNMSRSSSHSNSPSEIQQSLNSPSRSAVSSSDAKEFCDNLSNKVCS